MARVVIGLSGGVDSSVAAYLLKQQGHDVVGLFMINWHDTTGTLEGDCPWHDDRVFAELVAKKLDIPLHVVDLSADYRTRVVDYMFSEYEKGRTPNPDVLCNREIKFDVFLREALRLGADFVATGHYCRKAEETLPDGRTIYKLLAGTDPNKDQSYFLCQLSQEQLRYALFPVGALLKPEVRRIAAEQGLATAKRKDSQGICFVGKIDYSAALYCLTGSFVGNAVSRALGSHFVFQSIARVPAMDARTIAIVIAAAVVWFVLYKTKWGLRVRAVGEHPAAADTLGINVSRTRFICVVLSGVMAGFGGASITLAIISQFTQTAVAGQGFIALAAVIFGKWTPHGAFGACLLFGMAQALVIILGGGVVPIPSEILAIMPYILTLVVLVLFVGRSVAPKADGVPYEKGSRG